MSTLRILLATVLTGVVVGVMGVLFLGVLGLANKGRIALIATADAHAIPGWLAGMLIGLTTVSLAAWLARRFAPSAPQSAESVPACDQEKRPAIPAVVAVNFAGTGAAVGGGLALGPERPAIQFAGAIGRLIGRALGVNRTDLEILLAAAGGAGVATMFNAPLGCAAYTVETVLKRVDLRISVIALGVGAVAVGVARLLLGREVNFLVDVLPPVPIWDLFLFFLLGCGVGFLGWLHVHLTRKTAELLVLSRLSDMARAALIGAVVGWLAWFAPELVGVGDALTQGAIDGKFALWTMAAFFLVRFFLGPFSLAAGTPGGYFTPVLLLGALVGAMYATVVGSWLSVAGISPAVFVLAGMAVALASIAHAPFTGVLLVIETTGALSMALPMIVAVFGAVGVTRLLSTPPMGHGLETALRSLNRRSKHGGDHGQGDRTALHQGCPKVQ